MSQRNSALNVFIGICATFFSHLVVIGTLGTLAVLLDTPMFGGLFLVSLLAIGLAQVVYLLPLILWLRIRELHEMVKGVLIGAAITLLLNGSCFVLFWTNF